MVHYVAHGTDEGGLAYLAMDWLEGQDLAARLREGPLPLADTLTLARRVAGGLAATHAAGVVHRDVKPSNLFLPHGSVELATLLDFGVARSAPAASHATRRGVLLGTPGYMAPEQARRLDGVDERADIFALGCVLYECLTGRRAFAGTDLLEVLAKVLLDVPPAPSTLVAGIPRELDALVVGMLAKEPSARVPSCAELMRRLDVVEAAALRDQEKRAGSGRWRALAVGGSMLLGLAIGAAALAHLGGLRWHPRSGATVATSSPSSSLAAATVDAGAAPLVDDMVDVLVFEIDNRTLTPFFDTVASKALQLSLGRSHIIEPTTGSNLRRLAQDLAKPTPKIDESLGPLLRARDGRRVVTTSGSITAQGTGYVISLTAKESATGAHLVELSRSVDDSKQVLPAISAMGAQIRRAIGDTAVDPDAERLELSPNLEADQELYLGQSMEADGRGSDGLKHLARAVEIDPNYALGRDAYGISLFSSNQVPKAMEQLSVAYALREGLGWRDRAWIEAGYHYAAGDVEDAVAPLQAILAGTSRHNLAASMLASIYQRSGEYQRALELTNSRARRNPHDFISRFNQIYFGLMASRIEETEANGAQVERDFPNVAPDTRIALGVAHALGGHLEEARSEFIRVQKDAPYLGACALADLALFHGDARAASDLLTTVLATPPPATAPEVKGLALAQLADTRATLKDAKGALSAARAALAAQPDEGVRFRAGRLLARLKDRKSALAAAAVLDRSGDEISRINATFIRAEIALADGDASAAWRDFEAGRVQRDVVRAHIGLARADEALGHFGDAVREYRLALADDGAAAIEEQDNSPTMRDLPPLQQSLDRLVAAATLAPPQ